MSVAAEFSSALAFGFNAQDMFMDTCSHACVCRAFITYAKHRLGEAINADWQGRMGPGCSSALQAHSVDALQAVSVEVKGEGGGYLGDTG